MPNKNLINESIAPTATINRIKPKDANNPKRQVNKLPKIKDAKFP